MQAINPTPSPLKTRPDSKSEGATASNHQQRFLQVALNGSKVNEPTGVLAGR
jgi:hypothetical protein